MSSALQRMCDALAAAVHPVENASRDLHAIGSRLQATARHLNALGQSTASQDLRNAGVQLQAAEVALKRAAQFARGATQHARAYVSAMVGTGQVQMPTTGAGAQVIAPVTGPVSPERRRQLVRDVWLAAGRKIGLEIFWAAGMQMLEKALKVDMLPDDQIRQSIEDLPVTFTQIREVAKKWFRR